MSQLNDIQRQALIEQIEKQKDLRKLVTELYSPAIFENIKEIRETIRNLSITSGAIGALTINLLGNTLIKNKTLILIALAFFLFVVWEGFFYLKYILERENNSLSTRVDRLHESLTKLRAQLDNALKNNTTDELENVQSQWKSLEETIKSSYSIDDWFIRNIGDLTIIPFTIGCLFIFFAFINFNHYMIVQLIQSQPLFVVISILIILFYTFFAPEAFFHNTYKNEKPRLFDRWSDKRFIWNLHQSWIHFLGALTGCISLYVLFFILGVDNPKNYGVSHLVLFLIGLSGIMGFLPRILFGSVITK